MRIAEPSPTAPDVLLRRAHFYFLRHGETDWNAMRLCQGQSDVPLNATGVAQAHGAKTRLQASTIATVCSSPLARARQTAAIINEVLKRPLVIIDELQEIFFGAAQGKPLASLSYGNLLRSAAHHGGESFDGFVKRAVAGIDQALSHSGPVLIVSHGGIFYALQSHLRLKPDNRLTNGVPVLVEPGDGAEQVWAMRPV